MSKDMQQLKSLLRKVEESKITKKSDFSNVNHNNREHIKRLVPIEKP